MQKLDRCVEKENAGRGSMGTKQIVLRENWKFHLEEVEISEKEDRETSLSCRISL